MVGYVRRNFLVPIPYFESFDALNAHLERRCLERMDARLRGHTETIGQRMELDLDALLPLPAVPYDACEKQGGRVSSLSLVRYRTRDMSSSKLGLFELVVPLLDPEEEKRRAEIRAEDRERAREARNAANRRRRIAAKENGICLTCRNTPADPGIALCSKCRKTNQTRIRERYLRRKAAGLCKRCDNTARKDKTDCEECAKKQWEYDQRMRQGKKVAEPEAARQEGLTPRPRQAEIQNSQLKAASKEGDNARNE